MLVHQADLVAINPVVAHEEPTGEALRRTVARVGGQGARGLHRQGVDVAQEHGMCIGPLAAESVQLVGRQAQRPAIAISTSASWGDLSQPSRSCELVIPSRPISAISTRPPPAWTSATEVTPHSGKHTKVIGSSCATITCPS
jgi:hypothetical protein